MSELSSRCSSTSLQQKLSKPPASRLQLQQQSMLPPLHKWNLQLQRLVVPPPSGGAADFRVWYSQPSRNGASWHKPNCRGVRQFYFSPQNFPSQVLWKSLRFLWNWYVHISNNPIYIHSPTHNILWKFYNYRQLCKQHSFSPDPLLLEMEVEELKQKIQVLEEGQQTILAAQESIRKVNSSLLQRLDNLEQRDRFWQRAGGPASPFTPEHPRIHHYHHPSYQYPPFEEEFETPYGIFPSSLNS